MLNKGNNVQGDTVIIIIFFISHAKFSYERTFFFQNFKLVLPFPSYFLPYFKKNIRLKKVTVVYKQNNCRKN